MKICIYDCDHDVGSDNTAVEIRKILSGFPVDIYEAKNGKFPATNDYDGFIVTGSSNSPLEGLGWMKRLEAMLRTEKPVLGICFGNQLIAMMLGGRVEKMQEGVEFGYGYVDITEAGASYPLFSSIPRGLLTFHSHHFIVTELPEGAEILATNSRGIQAFKHGNYIGIQFHPDISWDMGSRLGAKRGLDPRHPGDCLVRDSRAHNKRILLNFAALVAEGH
ncbi:MAG: hypothetical protein DRO99_02795 [Candidatus Aenigmatarchaeota archaeon]|nr:MAG: hypothetical protein DRO99_02795 [Candidatus Aenigmarchaeota archaeon]